MSGGGGSGGIVLDVILTTTVAMAAVVLVIGMLGALRGGRSAGSGFRESVRLSLELLLAGGIVRLAAVEDLRTVGMVAAIVAVRTVIGLGVGFGARAASAPAPASRS